MTSPHGSVPITSGRAAAEETPPGLLRLWRRETTPCFLSRWSFSLETRENTEPQTWQRV